ncbi:Organic hydroperoxide resistance transcriptional regulator [Rothia kristinae]|nr:Organic hydroperoxide resistance transcriptional regulator [Rothia kristinae]
MDPGTLSPLVRRLEQIGYVHRQRDPEDERSVLLGLTDAGRKLREQAEEIPERMMRRLDLSLADVRQLHRSMTRLIAAARRAPDEET